VPDFIYTIPHVRLAIYFSLFAVGAIFFGLLIVKPVFRLLFGSGPEFNQNLNFGTAAFSLFYGLLLGQLTVSVSQNVETINGAIRAEASSLGILYSDMNSYREPTKSDMQAMLRDYVLFTIYRDWPAHRTGRFLDGGQNRASAMGERLNEFAPETEREAIVHAIVIERFGQFSDARQQRLAGVTPAIPTVLWYAVAVGAGITILILVLMKMPPHQQFLVGGISAFFLGVILLVLLTLDQPLRGDFGLEPGPLQQLWERQMRWDEGIPVGFEEDPEDSQDG
jgi:hypothetical protein